MSKELCSSSGSSALLRGRYFCCICRQQIDLTSRGGKTSFPNEQNAPPLELESSSLGKENFLRWKLYFPPLEIFFSKGGKLLEILRGVSSS